MADNQVVLAFRIPEEVSEKIASLMSLMGLGDASRSQVARKALELGLEQLEQQLHSAASVPKSIAEELEDLKKRVEFLEVASRKKSIVRDA